MVAFLGGFFVGSCIYNGIEIAILHSPNIAIQKIEEVLLKVL